jgi:hypothetical protein
VFDLVHAQAVSRGEPDATDPKNLITRIDLDNLAVQVRGSERLFNDAGKELLLRNKLATLTRAAA